jgi:hypothetical protein
MRSGVSMTALKTYSDSTDKRKMIMKTKERRNGRYSIITTTLLTVLFLVVLGGVDQAQAQWTTDGSGNTTVTSGNVGVGTSSPTRKLTITSSAAADGILIQNSAAGSGGVLDMQSTDTGGNLWRFATMGNIAGRVGNFEIQDMSTSASVFNIQKTTGNVGIGDTSPNGKLTVVGNISSEASSAHDSGIGLLGQDASNAYLQLYNSSRSMTTYFSAKAGVNSYINNGNFGVGTSSPSYKLDVGGQVNASGGLCIAGDCKNSWLSISSQWANSSSNIYYNTGSVGIGTSSTNQALTVSGYNSSGFGTTMQVIGPTSSGVAQNQLNITSTANTWGLILGQNNSGVASSLYHCANCAHIVNVNNAALVFGTNNTDRMRIDASGNVGIGTTAPSVKLDVRGSGANSGGKLAVVNSDATNAIGFYSGQNNDARAGIYWTSNTPLVLGTQTSGSVDGTGFAELVRITSGGNVGIGMTPNSDYKLDVNGSVRVSGNISAKYQDVAEWVPSTHTLSAGTVVTLNPNQSNQVMASTSAYDTRVAGVVSERPGLALGEEGKDKVLVATTGRVKVKVDATKAPVHIGDLLVTSDREGYAMKSEPITIGGRQIHAPGTLIGKALEPLEKGTGEILVLLSLQ